jgi:hypothetical protein
MSSKNDNKNIPNIRKFVILVILLWITTFFIILIFNKYDSNSGVLGDSFGILNALFSGLAFAILIYTMFLQKEELKLQRKELELTRNELKRSAKAQEESQKALTEQVKTMESTSILNAYDTLMNYNINLHQHRGLSSDNPYFKKSKAIENKILDIIESINGKNEISE